MTWESLEASLTRTLSTLADGTSAVADLAPAREAVVRPRRLGGLVGERREALRPYLQWLRLGDVLVAECVGGPQVGGVFPLTDAEHQALLALGWLPPAQHGVANYARDWSGPDAAAAAATLAVRTARDVLGCPGPDDVEVTLTAR